MPDLTISNIITGLFVLQVIAYVILESYHRSKWRRIVLLAYLLAYAFVIPYYYNLYISNEQNPGGTSFLVIHLGFWLIGGGSAIITHLIFSVIKHFMARQKKQ